jgi:hypothetical protein
MLVVVVEAHLFLQKAVDWAAEVMEVMHLLARQHNQAAQTLAVAVAVDLTALLAGLQEQAAQVSSLLLIQARLSH